MNTFIDAPRPSLHEVRVALRRVVAAQNQGIDPAVALAYDALGMSGQELQQACRRVLLQLKDWDGEDSHFIRSCLFRASAINF